MDAHLCMVRTNLHNLIQLCTFSSPNSSCGLFLYLPQHPLFLTFTLVRWSSECWCPLDAHVQMQLSPLCYLFPLPVTHWCSLAPLDHYSPLSLLGCKNTMKITIILHDYSLNFGFGVLLMYKKLSSIAVINIYLCIQQWLNFPFYLQYMSNVVVASCLWC